MQETTIVLVHGAFAESASWNDVIVRLREQGYPVIAAANPLRSVSGDAAFVADVVNSRPGPVVLVGHSYGGAVITNAALRAANVTALVYVAAFAPDTGESAADLSSRFPGSTLAEALAPPVPLAGGGSDLYIQQERFPNQFAADAPFDQAQLMAVTQRPITAAALNEPSGEPAWKTLPSWFIFGERDRNIPPEAMAFMAERAGARAVVRIPGASHVVMVSHPHAVARMIAEAASVTLTERTALR